MGFAENTQGALFRLRNILPKAVGISSVTTCFESCRKQRTAIQTFEASPTLKQSKPSSMEDSIIATECCAFCRGPFPARSIPGFDGWQSNVRAVLCLDLNNNESIELTEVFRLPDVDDDIDVPLTGHLQTLTISRDLRSIQHQTDRPAFCFHEWCYSVLKWKLKECDKSTIFKLARTLTPDPAIWENACERRHDLGSISMFQLLANNDSQPRLISRLPPELRTYIWQYIGLITPYSAFVLVAGETSRLARNLHHRSIRYMTLQRGSRLSAEMISAFGTEYIQDLIMDQDCKGSKNIVGDTTTVKYVSSLGGICAIQVLGIDWETGWIGKIPSADCVWYGMIRARVPTFQCDYNELNCATISLAGSFGKKQVVWDQPDFPSTLLDPDAALFNFDRDITRSTTVAPIRRFFRHLSLYCKDEYTNGLSVHVAGRGIVGLEAHFTQTSRLSGYRSGCQLYFPLCPEEYIAYSWLRIVNSPSSAFAAPALTIQTTRGRIHTFGSYILPSLVTSNSYKWILLQQEGCITGFYYESVNSGTAITRLGVIGNGTTPRTAPLPPQYHNCDFPSPPIGTPGAGLFLSVAILSSLKRVDICHVNKRCTGMLIYYMDGRTVVLGQWHTCPSRCSCIYNGGESGISKIYFRISKSGDRQIITDISFSPNAFETTPDSHCQVFTVGQHVAWWFSERYDKILSWTGDLSHIPGESIMSGINI